MRFPSDEAKKQNSFKKIFTIGLEEARVEHIKLFIAFIAKPLFYYIAL